MEVSCLCRLGRVNVDLYQHHYPAKRVDVARLMGLIGRRCRGGQGQPALASGALSGYLAGARRPRGLRRFMPAFRRKGRESALSVVGMLREIGAGHGTGPSQVAIRWLLENDSVLPIPGAKNGAQAVANAQSLSIRLSPDELDALNRATLAWRE